MKTENEDLNSIDSKYLLNALNNTSICVFTYFPKTKRITIPKKTCDRYQCKAIYDNMPDSFAEEVVNNDDHSIFKEMYYRINRGEKTASTTFHNKNLDFCWRVTLTTVSWDEFNSPEEVLGVIEDVSEISKSNALVEQIKSELNNNDFEENTIQESVNLIASAIGGQYYAIFHLCVATQTFICFQEQMPKILNSIGNKGTCEQAWKTYVDSYVDPEDQNKLNEFSKLDNLVNRLKDNHNIILIYRRIGVGWTRGQFIAAKRDENGNVTDVIFTVSDINEEIDREQKNKQAIYEAQHDPLTGVLNRNGFEKIISSETAKKGNVGFALLDIDNFKSLNDTYGHDVGDRILRNVVEDIKNVLSSTSYLFRLGGDEFGILLQDFSMATWDSFCKKLEIVHHSLQEQVPHDMMVTLSIGLCYSTKGYNEKMYLLADDALYETKCNGRVGATLIDINHNIVKRWRDEGLSLHGQSAWDYNNMGLYRIEYDVSGKRKPRLISSETAKSVLSFPMNATPEEIYTFWLERIAPADVDVLRDAKNAMDSGGQVECTYEWNHPKWGKILVRTGGYCEKIDGLEIYYGFHHSLKDTKIVSRKDDSGLLISALTEAYFCSYYIDLENDSYSPFKIASGEKTLKLQSKRANESLKRFISMLVSPKDRDNMSAFMNLATLQERIKDEKFIDCEYTSLSNRGHCSARFIPVKYDENGKLTHVLFLITAMNSDMNK